MVTQVGRIIGQVIDRYAMEAKNKVAKVISKVPLNSAKTDFEYWQTQSYEARLAALEEIRREYHLWKYHAEPGFQRVYKIVKR